MVNTVIRRVSASHDAILSFDAAFFELVMRFASRWSRPKPETIKESVWGDQFDIANRRGKCQAGRCGSVRVEVV